MRDNEPLALEKWGLAVKLYPCCGSTHRIIDCVIELRNEHGFTADQVVAVETLIGYNNMKNLPFGQPKNEMEARFSMQYCVAVALLNGALMLSDFTQEGVDRPEVRALLPITTGSAHPLEADSADPTKRLPHTARIRLKNGRVLERSTQWAKGTIHNPFNDADRTAKYMSCCSRFFSEDEVSVVKYKLDNFHELSNVEKLMAHLRKDID
jgi:2-methylcitrate dehydratase PrpD